MGNLRKVSPWIEYYRQVEALFKKDPAVKVTFDEDTKRLLIYVNGQAKADAIARLMPESIEFGNVTVTISIIPANDEKSMGELLRDAFFGNDALSFMYTSPGPVLEGMTYVVFKPEVVQYFGDNLMDINGNCSALFEDLAREVFIDQPGIAYCTDSVSYELHKPLGEWP